MLFSEMPDEDFLNILRLAVKNDGPAKRKTQLDLRVFTRGLSGEPLQVADWEPFNEKEIDELMRGFAAALQKEARRRFLVLSASKPEEVE